MREGTCGKIEDHLADGDAAARRPPFCREHAVPGEAGDGREGERRFQFLSERALDPPQLGLPLQLCRVDIDLISHDPFAGDRREDTCCSL